MAHKTQNNEPTEDLEVYLQIQGKKPQPYSGKKDIERDNVNMRSSLEVLISSSLRSLIS